MVPNDNHYHGKLFFYGSHRRKLFIAEMENVSVFEFN